MTALSVIIPVLNEEANIGACLEALASQKLPIEECIVVDNNCTDRSIDIARSYSGRLPLRIVVEKRPGVVWARERGFEAATGVYVGRVDADTRADPEWSQTAVDFMDAHPEIAGISGPTYPFDVPFATRVEAKLRQASVDPEQSRGRERENLFGANMVVRREAWEASRDRQLRAANVHEDIDLCLAFKKCGLRTWYLPTLLAAQSYRRMKASPISNFGYTVAGPRTYRLHGEYKMVALLWLMIPMWLITGWLIWAALLPYDVDTQTWSWRHIFRTGKGRLSPVE